MRTRSRSLSFRLAMALTMLTAGVARADLGIDARKCVDAYLNATRFIGQLAVVGGTGYYAGAGGTMLFREVGTGAYVLSFDYDVDR